MKSPPKATDLAPEALRARLRRWLFARVLIVTVFLGAVAASHVSSNSDPSFPLRGIADFYEEEVDNAVANLTALMEPIVIVFLGVVIGGLVISMYLPIFQLGAVISQ